jgi:hypothetical protein
VRLDPPRRYDRITRRVLDRLSEIAAGDRNDRFQRRPRWALYRDRVLCVALCQGGALHYVDGRNGVKDLDVWSFFAEADIGPFPARWRRERRFDLEPFKGHYVDLICRSLPDEIGADPVLVLERHLSRAPTASARALAQKAIVLLDPERLRGRVVWPTSE